MKSLYTYITEERMRLKDIPFDLDLFKKFIQDAIIDFNYEDSEYWEPMKISIINKYNTKIWDIFRSYCESYLELQDNTSIEEFYNKFAQIPLDRFNRALGAGSNGVVLSFHDKIIKIYYGNKIKNTDEPFYKWCLNNDSKVFPKIYKMGKNWCVMELLKTRTPKCIKYMNIIDNFPVKNFKIISDIAKGKTLEDTSVLTKDQLEVYNWCLTVKKTMDEINNRYISYPGDLVLNNIGERENGDIVFFDI